MAGMDLAFLGNALLFLGPLLFALLSGGTTTARPRPQTIPV